jgi:hypothetical protein
MVLKIFIGVRKTAAGVPTLHEPEAGAPVILDPDDRGLVSGELRAGLLQGLAILLPR